MDFVKIDSASLCTLLQRVFLSGTITEALMEISSGVVSVHAIDPSSSVYVSTKIKIGDMEDGTLGVSDIGALIKVLDFDGDVLISTNKKYLFVRRVAGKSRAVTVRFRLVDTKNITTAVENQDGGNGKLIKQTPIEILVTEDIRTDIITATNLVSVFSLTFEVEDGVLKVSTPKDHDSSFTCSLGKVSDGKASVTVYPKQFLEALKVMQLGKHSSLRMGKNAPLVLQQKDTLWAFTPVDMSTVESGATDE